MFQDVALAQVQIILWKRHQQRQPIIPWLLSVDHLSIDQAPLDSIDLEPKLPLCQWGPCLLPEACTFCIVACCRWPTTERDGMVMGFADRFLNPTDTLLEPGSMVQ